MSFNPDRVNIHELTIEEPEREAELPFDVERDITKEDREKINHELIERDKYGEWQNGELAVAAKILLDGQSEDTPKITQSLKKAFEETRVKNSWGRFAGHAGKFKILAPERVDEIKITPFEKMQMEHELLHKISPYGISGLADKVGLKILFPKVNFRELSDVSDYEILMEQWQKDKDDIGIETSPLSLKDPFRFFEKTAQLRLLGFEFTENVTFTEKQWEYINSMLSRLRIDFGGNYHKLCRVANDLKIITATRAEITDKGIEVEMLKKKDSLTSDTPPIPEIKKF